MQRSTEALVAKRPVGQVHTNSETPLVLSHPLDFDWRFTRSTASFLWENIGDLTDPRADVALLGTPSLASVERPQNLGSVTLFERNPSHYLLLSEGITFACCDVLRDPIPRGANSVVIADPPWYEAEMIGFLWTASTLAGTGAHVLLSMPPAETRPGIEEERERITAAAAQFGLELVCISDGVLRYRTPFFETNAMRAAGMSLPDDWRPGDLAIFRRTEATSAPRPLLGTKPVWIERSLGKTRFKLQETASTGFVSPILRPIVPGDVLPSVSRRDPRRRSANVWTSGNRIFSCDGTGTLTTIIESINTCESPEITVSMRLGRVLTTTEMMLVETAVQQIRNVVKWESAEFRGNHTLGAISRLGPVRYRPITLERAG